MQPTALFGPLDTVLAPNIEYVVLALVLVNMGTRLFAYRGYVRQANDDDEESLSRNPVHEVSNVLVVVSSFYLLTLHHHAGIVLSTLALGLFITDFFEFEARAVEARKDEDLSRPKAAVVASLVVFMYAAYLSVFYLVKPFWSEIV